jgi:hypothetical protein
MDARRISLAVALAGSIGLAAASLAFADDAASPAERASPTPQAQMPMLPPGAAQGPTTILIPDQDADSASSGSTSGTLLILIPRRAHDAAPQAPHTPALQSPSLVPSREPIRILEA